MPGWIVPLCVTGLFHSGFNDLFYHDVDALIVLYLSGLRYACDICQLLRLSIVCDSSGRAGPRLLCCCYMIDLGGLDLDYILLICVIVLGGLDLDYRTV